MRERRQAAAGISLIFLLISSNALCILGNERAQRAQMKFEDRASLQQAAKSTICETYSNELCENQNTCELRNDGEKQGTLGCYTKYRFLSDDVLVQKYALFVALFINKAVEVVGSPSMHTFQDLNLHLLYLGRFGKLLSDDSFPRLRMVAAEAAACDSVARLSICLKNSAGPLADLFRQYGQRADWAPQYRELFALSLPEMRKSVYKATFLNPPAGTAIGGDGETDGGLFKNARKFIGPQQLSMIAERKNVPTNACMDKAVVTDVFSGTTLSNDKLSSHLAQSAVQQICSGEDRENSDRDLEHSITTYLNGRLAPPSENDLRKMFAVRIKMDLSQVEAEAGSSRVQGSFLQVAARRHTMAKSSFTYKKIMIAGIVLTVIGLVILIVAMFENSIGKTAFHTLIGIGVAFSLVGLVLAIVGWAILHKKWQQLDQDELGSFGSMSSTPGSIMSATPRSLVRSRTPIART